MKQCECDKKIEAAVITLKKEIDDLLTKVLNDNEKLLKENYALSQQLKSLAEKVSKHQDVMFSACPHTER